MPRSIRIEYPGGFYHVMARGNRREPIFLDDKDREFFLKTLGEACGMTGWRVHAWVLMGNHYHVLLETPEANLVAGMQWLQNAYTRRFNVRHGQWGRLFGDRYKAVLVEGAGYYYETLLDYIHLNPVRAGLLKPKRGQSVMDFAWSSVAGGYALRPRERPVWLAAEAGLGAFDCADTAAGRRRWMERLDGRAKAEEAARCGVPTRAEEADARRSDLRRGWYWGSQAFAERVLKLSEVVLKKTRHRSYRASGERRAHGESDARKLMEEGMAVATLDAASLRELPGSDARKVAIARLIWETTTVDMTWIADNLEMCSAANASQQIRRHRNHPPALPKDLRKWIDVSRNVA